MTIGSPWAGLEGAPRGPDGLGPGRQRWRAGWDREERCPADPKGDSSPGSEGWRSSALLEGLSWWAKAHKGRRDAVRSLRAAGYVARHRWARRDNGWRTHGRADVPSWTYDDGPVAGLEAIDPWRRAAQLAACSSTWVVQPRVSSAGGFLALPMPTGCGQHHVCEVCAGRRSRELARAVRAYVASRPEQGLALVTLTHQGIPGESLADALARWRRAWELMVRGRPGRRLRESVAGWYYGIEVTRSGPWWHLHGHVIVGLAPDADEATTRTMVARSWHWCTEQASPGHGWRPIAGCWDKRKEPDPRHALARIAAGDYTGGWWRTIPADDDKAVYQACKYPTPVGSLSPLHLAEFLAAAHRRQWHQGGWEWRSIRREGSALAAEAIAEDPSAGDIGVPVASLAPGHCPDLDQIRPGAGLIESVGRGPLPGGAPPGPDPPGLVRFVLVADALGLAEQWSGEGWCRVGTAAQRRQVPADADDPRAFLVERRHPSGRSELVHRRWETEILPTLTMSARRAARAVDELEAQMRQADAPIDVDPAGLTLPAGSAPEPLESPRQV